MLRIYKLTNSHCGICSVSTRGQHFQTTFRCQWLCACDDTLGPMNHTPSAWERDELWVGRGVDGFRVKRHDEDDKDA
jgi:hypothetical protein